MNMHTRSCVLPRRLDQAQPDEQLLEFVRISGYKPEALVFVEQVHGTEVHEVWSTQDCRRLQTADALITNIPNVALVIRTADCVPLVFFDPIRDVIAVAHAGWKGIASGVIDAVLERMQSVYGCVVDDIRVTIGPAICGEHYDVSTVSDNRVQTFASQFLATDGVVLRDGERVRLDLPQACVMQYLRLGGLERHIKRSGVCTFQDQAFPSHRREGSQRVHHVWTWACLEKGGI